MAFRKDVGIQGKRWIGGEEMDRGGCWHWVGCEKGKEDGRVKRVTGW